MPDTRAWLRVEALGPLQVYRGPLLVDLGPTKQRAVFALLVLHAGEVVTMDTLLEGVWGEVQPPSARHLVHTYIARLRQIFEPDQPRRGRVTVIGSAPNGYRLLIDVDQIDLMRFQQLVAKAKQHLAIGEKARTFDLLGEAVRLWRDPSLSELGTLLVGASEVEVLRRAWTEATLDYITVGLELGEGPAVLLHAQQLVAVEPMHEEAQARYLAVLEQTGQRAAAIEHFSGVRARLSDELGVEPGAQLSGAYRRILLGSEQRPVDPLYALSAAAPARPPWRGPGPGLGDLIEREEESKSLVQILSVQRLLTVAGPPGCGKSALALHTAAEVRDAFLGGVAVVDCADLEDLDQVQHRLTGLFASSPEVSDITKVIDEQQVLIVLDNVEHLVDPCACFVDGIVRTNRYASILVTSREPLGLPDETVWRLGTLSVPDSAADDWPGDNPAVQLFVRRATQVCPDFQLEPANAGMVATICRQLDGLPLAVELSAACLATDTLEGVLRRLEDPLHEISPARRGPPAHHRSLWTALRRSAECLTEIERLCFVRLGKLPLCFDLRVAQQVWESAPACTLDVRKVLSRLVDKSLLFVQHGGTEPSYRMLWLVQRFAAEMATAEAA